MLSQDGYTATDNMTSLMTVLGLAAGDYSFKVVPSGSGEALRLRILSPPGIMLNVQ